MKKFIKGTIIGGLVGATLGILFAPKSGKETRQQIKQGAQNVAKDLQVRLQKLGDQVASELTALKAVAGELTEEAKEESQELLSRGAQFQSDLKLAISELAASTQSTGQQAAEHWGKLADEGQSIAKEARRVAKTVAGSAATKIKSPSKRRTRKSQAEG